MNTITSSDGTRIAYDTAGDGPLVVIVGGALQTRSDHLMGRLAPLLAHDFRVVSYDRRGRGGSSDAAAYAIDREIEDLDAVIRDSGGSAFVFGNSSGGSLALLAAAKLPSIRKLAVYEAPFIPTDDAAAYIAQLEAYNRAGERGKAVALFLERIGVPAFVRAIMRIAPMWPKLKAVAPTLLYDARIVGDGHVPAVVEKIGVPVLVLSGSSPRMQEAAGALTARLPDGRAEILERQTHDVQPPILASALTRFFLGKETSR